MPRSTFFDLTATAAYALREHGQSCVSAAGVSCCGLG
jgi:hypothetical protein